MPLFFIIAIGCGAATLGAATVDVTTDARASHTAQVQSQSQTAQAQKMDFDASAYASTTDCLNAAALQGAPTSACQKS